MEVSRISPIFISITVYEIIGIDNHSYYFIYESKIYQYLIIDNEIQVLLIHLRSKDDLNLWSKVKKKILILFKKLA